MQVYTVWKCTQSLIMHQHKSSTLTIFAQMPEGQMGCKSDLPNVMPASNFRFRCFWNESNISYFWNSSLKQPQRYNQSASSRDHVMERDLCGRSQSHNPSPNQDAD